MTQDLFSWKIGGEAGFGIVTSGAIFAKTCLRAGMSVFDYMEYPSLIRGGHNTYQLTARRLEIRNPKSEILNKSQIQNFKRQYVIPDFDPGSRNKQQKEKDLNSFGVSFGFLDSRLHGNDNNESGNDGMNGYVLAPNKCVDILVALNKETITLHLKELCGKGLVIYDGEKIDVSDVPGVEAKNICDPKTCDLELVKDHPVFFEGGPGTPPRRPSLRDPSTSSGINLSPERSETESKGYQNDYPFQTRFYSVPFNRLAREAGGDEVMRNTVSLGASFAFLNCNFELLEDVLQEQFLKKPDVAETNVKAARSGFEYVGEHYISKAVCQLTSTSRGDLLLTGNEAIGLGALSAGLKFYAAYPMTPSSSLLHYLAEKQKELDFVVKHTEDEISAIQHALGASFAGVRAMCGTSGGGFSLMVESVGLAGMTETPIVIMVAMRPGPATGLPTWTEQGDLRFVIHAAQGDFPRVVLAPGDAEEAFLLTRQGFEISEKYQIPVFVLSDKYLSESRMTVSKAMVNDQWSNERYNIILDQSVGAGLASAQNRAEVNPAPTKGIYQRYPTDQVLNSRTIPGLENGIFVANSDEHDAFGASSEEANMRTAQMERRMKRLELILQENNELSEPNLYGDQDSNTLLIGWGSTKGVVLEVLNLLNREGTKLAFLHFNWLWPFPAEKVVELMHKYKKVIVIENNYTGQLEGLLQQFTGLAMEYSIRKYDGRPFFPEELVELVKMKIQ